MKKQSLKRAKAVEIPLLTHKEERQVYVAVIIGIILIVTVIFWLIPLLNSQQKKQDEKMQKEGCAYYKNYTIGYVPVTCLRYFINHEP